MGKGVNMLIVAKQDEERTSERSYKILRKRIEDIKGVML